MATYYNELDPFAAAWVRELIKAGHITPGEVDERDIREVQPADLKGFTQCHFFAGIGVWSYALRAAGWPDDRPVWTGSCPCQPFSAAGNKKGTQDDRHLWPAWFKLIRECNPPVVFGEQVASAEVIGSQLEAAFVVAVQQGEFAKANKLAKQLVASPSFHYFPRWLDLISSELEDCNYTIRPGVMGAHSVGAPHIRQRLYFVAEASRELFDGIARVGGRSRSTSEQERRQPERDSGAGRMADAADSRRARAREHDGGPSSLSPRPEQCGGDGEYAGRMADAAGTGRPTAPIQGGNEPQDGIPREDGELGHASGPGLAQRKRNRGIQRQALELYEGKTIKRGGYINGPDRIGTQRTSFWADAEWLWCRDQKYRPVEPGTFPLVTGAPNRVGRLRGYGNALCAPVAQGFIEAYLEIA